MSFVLLRTSTVLRRGIRQITEWRWRRRCHHPSMKFFIAPALFAVALAFSPAAHANPPDGAGDNNNSQGSVNGVGHADDGTADATGGHADHGNGNGFGHGPGDNSVPELSTSAAASAAA